VTEGRYTSPLRERQKEQTRMLILEAVARLLRQGELAAVTMASVAAAAEVTERTVYRHFLTREELLSAFWQWEMARAGGEDIVAPTSIDAFIETMRALFISLDAEEGLVRAVLAAPEGRAIRRAPSMARLALMVEFLRPLTPALDENERHATASAIASLSSIPSWLYMRDVSGYDGKRAAEAAALGIRWIIEGATRKAAP
jgi:AcrR family transcriptional regulator